MGQAWFFWLSALVMCVQVILLLGLLYQLGKGHLAQRWLVLMCLFTGAVLLGADQLGAGLLCVVAVFLVWKHLHQVYAGEIRPRLLLGSGLIAGFLLAVAPHSGLALTLGLGVFSVLHCFLHEREEKNISYTQVSNKAVLHRWLRLWGRYWLLPTALAFGASTLVGGIGLVNTQVPARLLGLTGLALPLATGIGYFSTFHQEFQNLFFVPFQKPSGFGASLSVERIVLAIWLILLGFLPVLGIIGLGAQVPNRFVYRLLQRPDEELLLIFITGTALILGTLGHSTSSQIASYGPLALLMGFMVTVRWLRTRPRLEPIAYLSLWAVSLLCLLVMLWLKGFSIFILWRLNG